MSSSQNGPHHTDVNLTRGSTLTHYLSRRDPTSIELELEGLVGIYIGLKEHLTHPHQHLTPSS